MTEFLIERQTYRIVFVSWIIAMVATFGSLFFSNVMGFTPCSLCWYQRIFMYPLAVIFLVALLKFDRHVFRYAIGLIGIGWIIALYHNLLQWKIIPESVAPCVQGVPCTTEYINWLGFITIPLLSFTAFSLLGILAYFYFRSYQDESKN